ncbi:16S rRNA (guanine(966)-N(2))-methyltransferase RsmD [Candidatus Sumerlaeota bacterium]|nr:16S rRNA (guanine(966)-N(2))-methyltransferase RsmD [Candidatus Sumerlaeota bacterium]
MRIIGGKHKGARLKTRKGSATRPLLARVKKSLFSIILPELEGARFLDLFAGNGSVGIEALSRGAEYCVFVDQSERCCKIIRENLKHLGLSGKTLVLQKKVSSAISILEEQGQKFNIVFIGAPYKSEFALRTIEQLGRMSLLQDTSLVIAEVRKRTPLPEHTGFLHLVRNQQYGDTELFFYEYKRNAEAEGNAEESGDRR